MFGNAIVFVLNTLIGLFTICVLLRFYLQLTGAPFKNPLSQMVVALTNFAVIPARRFVPSWRKLDLASLFVALVSQVALNTAVKLISGGHALFSSGGFWLSLSFISLFQLAELSIYIFIYAVIAQAILSWVNPYTPISGVLDALTRPIMAPIRRHIPPVGGVDLSPLVFFIVAQLIIMLLIQPLEMQFNRLI